MSEAPPGPGHYTDDKLWADDLAAIIGRLGLERAVLVGWSYGSLVICDYIRAYGQDRVAAINFVEGVVKLGEAAFGTLIGPGFLDHGGRVGCGKGGGGALAGRSRESVRARCRCGHPGPFGQVVLPAMADSPGHLPDRRGLWYEAGRPTGGPGASTASWPRWPGASGASAADRWGAALRG